MTEQADQADQAAEPDEPEQPAPSRGRRVLGVARVEVRAFAELFALAGFAIAQPLYEIFGKAPDQFIFRGAVSEDIVRFALLILFAPALAGWLVEVVVGLVSTTARRWLHVGLLATLVAAFAMEALRRTLGDGYLLAAAAVLVGVLAGVLYVRTTGAKVWLAFVSLAPPVFCAIFLLASQTSQLLSDPGAAGDIRIGKPAPVVMIVFDELPLASLMDHDGTIDAGLFPHFAELAGQSHWFRNTTSVSNFTLNAVPSIATGMVPEDDSSPTAASHPKNLFTLLGGRMELEVVESVTRLCPAKLCDFRVPPHGGLEGLLTDARSALGQELAPNPKQRDPVAGLVDEGPAEAENSTPRGGAQVAADVRARTFLDGLKDDSDTVHFLHVLLPHVPFRYLPDGTQYAGPNPDLGRDGDIWQDQPALVQLGRQRHLLQLQYADAVLGEAMDAMKAHGLYDDALFTVVADHGISFQAGQPIRGLDLSKPLNDSTASEIMWVPFFLKEPGQTEGTVDDDNVETIDVLPTMADVLDTKIPWKIDGRSALDQAPRTTKVKKIYQADHTASAYLAGKPYSLDEDRGWKLLLTHAVDRFAPRSGKDRLFRVGPHPELFGVQVADTQAGQLQPLGAVFDPTSDASNVDRKSGKVPALVRAIVDQASTGDPVAVAVNGTIYATVDAYRDAGATQVAAIVPDRAFRQGKNTVSLYRVTS